MEGGTSSELMHSHVFAMKPMYLALRASFWSQQLLALAISVHVDESGHRASFWLQREAEWRFPGNDGSSWTTQRGNIDDLSWSPVRRGSSWRSWTCYGCFETGSRTLIEAGRTKATSTWRNDFASKRAQRWVAIFKAYLGLAWSSTALGKRSCEISGLATPWTRIFLLTSISSSTMCTLPNDPFVEPLYSLKKAFTRLLPPTPQSADCANINIARPSSAPPILMTPSSTIRAANIPMPASKMLLNLSVPKWTLTLIESNFQVIRFMPSLSARNKLYLSPLVWIHSNLYLLLLIILI